VTSSFDMHELAQGMPETLCHGNILRASFALIILF
jgi:hypothetical protein